MLSAKWWQFCSGRSVLKKVPTCRNQFGSLKFLRTVRRFHRIELTTYMVYVHYALSWWILQDSGTKQPQNEDIIIISPFVSACNNSYKATAMGIIERAFIWGELTPFSLIIFPHFLNPCFSFYIYFMKPWWRHDTNTFHIVCPLRNMFIGH